MKTTILILTIFAAICYGQMDTLYYEDFEAGASSWDITAPWELTTLKFHSGGNSLLCNFEDSLSTEAMCQLPVIESDCQCSLSYWVFNDLPDHEDSYYEISLSNDAGATRHLLGYDVPEGSPSWTFKNEALDTTDSYANLAFEIAEGESTWLIFTVHTPETATGVYEGLYIDDITVMMDTLAFDTCYSGEVMGTWDSTHSPYFICGDIEVPDGTGLTIGPGVDLLFLGAYSFTVEGNLQMMGTEEDSIILTCIDTTEKWDGLYYDEADGINRVEYCQLSNAYTSSYSYGAGLTADNSNIQISNSKFHDNNSGHGGGAIFLDDHTVSIIRNSEFTNNMAESGAGIYCRDSYVTIDSTLFSNNEADEGAAIKAEACTLEINNSTIDSNITNEIYSFSNPGTIKLSEGLYFISNSTFYSNICSTGTASVYGNYLTINNCVFIDNYGEYTIRGELNLLFCNLSNNVATDIVKLDGIFSEIESCIFCSNSGRTVWSSADTNLITNCVIDSNSGQQFRFEYFDYVYFDSCEFVNCYSGEEVDFLSSSAGGSSIVTNSLYENNIGYRNLFNSLNEAEFHNCIFRHNDAMCLSQKLTRVDNCSFIGNTGRSIYSKADTCLITNCVIDSNSGQQFRFEYFDYVYFDSCEFVNCYSGEEVDFIYSSAGGSSVVTNSFYENNIGYRNLFNSLNEAEFHNCDFRNNDAMCLSQKLTRVDNCSFIGNTGRSIYSKADTCLITNCVIDSNMNQQFLFDNFRYYVLIESCQVTNCENIDDTDLMYSSTDYDGTTHVTNSTFEDNRLYDNVINAFNESEIINCLVANNDAIGVYGNYDIYNCRISNNKGGVFSSKDICIVNTIIDNNASEEFGGIYMHWFGDLFLINCTVVDNYSDGNGGGIYSLGFWSDDRYIFLLNTIIWNNYAVDSGDAIYCHEGYLVDHYIHTAFSCYPLADCDGGHLYYDAGSHIGSNPFFGEDYSLIATSPCVNSGSPGVVFSATHDTLIAPDTDINGYPRPYGSGYDMGAWEWPNTKIDEEEIVSKPKAFTISAHPNPFNSAVSITAPAGAEIEIFNIEGRMVDKLSVGAGLKPARAGGSETFSYECVWQPNENLGSGVYLVRAKYGDESVSKRIVYLK